MTAQARIRVVGADEVPGLAEDLAAVLVDCVAGGASVRLTAPLEMPRAARFWMNVADGIAQGDRILLVAESHGRTDGHGADRHRATREPSP